MLSTKIISPSELEHAVSHVFFLAPQLGTLRNTAESRHSLARAVWAAAYTHSEIVDDTLKPRWSRITRMLENLPAIVQSEHRERSSVIPNPLDEMGIGGMLLSFLQTIYW